MPQCGGPWYIVPHGSHLAHHLIMPISTVLFDLDNTLYPATSGLMKGVDVRIGEYVQKLLGLGEAEARQVVVLDAAVVVGDVDAEEPDLHPCTARPAATAAAS